MPEMPRPSSKAKKIAYSILGIPENMNKQSETKKQIDRRLKYQYSSRVR